MKKSGFDRSAYTGKVRASITIYYRKTGETSGLSLAVSAILSGTVEKFRLINWIYVLMPDHVHMILEGKSERSDMRAALRYFKRKTLAVMEEQDGIEFEWQKGFCARLHGSSDDLREQIKQVAEMPVTQKIVKKWYDHADTGSANFVLEGMIA